MCAITGAFRFGSEEDGPFIVSQELAIAPHLSIGTEFKHLLVIRLCLGQAVEYAQGNERRLITNALNWRRIV